MKYIIDFHRTELTKAIEKEDIDIIRLLLSCPNINVNVRLIFHLFIVLFFILFFFMELKIIIL